MVTRLLIATLNANKLRDTRELLGDLPLELVSLAELGLDTEVETSGRSYEANALLHAEAYMRRSGLPTLADAMGLEVAILNGAPGVQTQSYEAEDGVKQQQNLLDQLRDIPFHQRLARYVCCVALALPNHPAISTEATLSGVIEVEARGKSTENYEALFYLLEDDCTLAQVSQARYLEISPYSEAIRSLHPQIEQCFNQSQSDQ